MYQSTEPCPRCGAQNLRGTWVCPHCGNTLLIYCPNCSAANVSGSQYCQQCGSPLTSTSPAPTQPSSQPYPQYPSQDYQTQGQQPYTGTGYGAQGGQQPYTGADYGAQGGQQPYQGYQQYPGYGAYPPPPPSLFQSVTARLKQVALTTNPFLLSALVVLVVGLAIFFILAFQFQWIKTAQPQSTTVTSTDKRVPQMSMLQVKPGTATQSAVIYWVTDVNSSSQVAYGIYPFANTLTPIQDDPTTGVNPGVLTHEVTLSNLMPQSQYAYIAYSVDKDGNKAESPLMQFNTTQ